MSQSKSNLHQVSFTKIIKSTFEQKEQSPGLSFDHYWSFHGPNFFPWPPGSWMVDISSLSGIDTMSWYQWYQYLMVSMVSIQWYQVAIDNINTNLIPWMQVLQVSFPTEDLYKATSSNFLFWDMQKCLAKFGPVVRFP